MLSPKVNPPTPHRAPNAIAFNAAKESDERISINELPDGTESIAPRRGNTIHANMPCTSQKFSQLH